MVPKTSTQNLKHHKQEHFFLKKRKKHPSPEKTSHNNEKHREIIFLKVPCKNKKSNTIKKISIQRNVLKKVWCVCVVCLWFVVVVSLVVARSSLLVLPFPPLDRVAFSLSLVGDAAFFSSSFCAVLPSSASLVWCCRSPFEL